jgi:hypothetical protein
MPDQPTAEEIERRKRWFDRYTRALDEASVSQPEQPGISYRCPCCRFRTLTCRGGFEICEVCFWEDDGQDDHDADVVRGGPNASLSLSQARENFRLYGACDRGSVHHVRKPLQEEE